MSSRFVIDASALIRYLVNGAGGDRIEQLLTRAHAGQAELLMSSVNWGEVFYVLLRDYEPAQARQLASWLRQLPFTVVSSGEPEAEHAAVLKQQFHLPYADSYAGALAQRDNATLVTADYDFKAMTAAIKIVFLPAEPGKRNQP